MCKSNIIINLKNILMTVVIFSTVLPDYSAHAATIADSYDISMLGLTGYGYTRSDGYTESQAITINNKGQVIGSSSNFVGTKRLGQSAWLYDGKETIKLGLNDSVYLRDDGYSSIGLKEFNDEGKIVGSQSRYKNNASLGSDAWYYNGETTRLIGLTGYGYTRNDGYRSNYASSMNKYGHVSGHTSNYIGSSSKGRTAWLYDGNKTTILGMQGSEYIKEDGTQISNVGILNDNGFALGNTTRYSGMRDIGAAHWIYDGNKIKQIGLLGDGYTRQDGYNRSQELSINQNGIVIGNTSRWNGDTYQGSQSWIYDGNSTFKIGLSGETYTRNDGFSDSTVGIYQPNFLNSTAINANGQVIGRSQRYKNGTGQDTWIYNGSDTLQLGLTGGKFTTGLGYQFSEALILNNNGQVSGISQHYMNNDISSRGQSIWFYDGVNSKEIGLIGNEYQTIQGLTHNELHAMNNKGDVVGISRRYDNSTQWQAIPWFFNGAETKEIEIVTTGTRFNSLDFVGLNELGQAFGNVSNAKGTMSWLYDSSLDEIFTFDISTNSEGHALSQIGYLSDEGLALGSYTLFGNNDENLGQRLFAFTVKSGVVDLGEIIADGFEDQGWETLIPFLYSLAPSAYGNTNVVNEIGQLIGRGELDNGSRMAFLLTPNTPVPIPASAWLFGTAIFSLINLKRIKS